MRMHIIRPSGVSLHVYGAVYINKKNNESIGPNPVVYLPVCMQRSLQADSNVPVPADSACKLSLL